MSWVSDNILYLLLGIGVLFNFLWLLEFKKQLNMNTLSCAMIAVLSVVAGVLSVRLFAFLESDGGMSLFGGIFFMPLFFFLVAKILNCNVAGFFDVITICMIFTVMCARVNCWISGCCVGLPVPGIENLHWPTRQLEIIFYIILLIKLGNRVGKNNTNGIIYPIYMMAYGLFRFVIEWLREPGALAGVFHIAHIWSIIAFVIGAFTYIIILKTKKEGNVFKKKEGAKK